MKLKILILLLAFMAFAPSAWASFPVKRATTEAATHVNVQSDDTATPISPAATSLAAKQMSTALLLWFFLGGFAAHRWYLGSPVGWNILFILTLGGVGIWWIIDGVDIITEKYPGL